LSPTFLHYYSPWFSSCCSQAGHTC